jgi:Transposase
VSESSWNRWRNQYGGMKANEAKRLRELESENARLKKLLAEAELDKAMLKELSEDAGVKCVSCPRVWGRASGSGQSPDPRFGPGWG